MPRKTVINLLVTALLIVMPGPVLPAYAQNHQSLSNDKAAQSRPRASEKASKKKAGNPRKGAPEPGASKPEAVAPTNEYRPERPSGDQ